MAEGLRFILCRLFFVIMENTYFVYAMLCFTSFLTLANPLGTMPVFLTLTQNFDEKERAKVLKKAIIVAFFVMIAFTIFGQFIFKFFGLSTNGFRIVGGIVIFKIGFDMLQARFTPVRATEAELQDYANDITITPLAIPILCGPGAIANGIVLMEEATDTTMMVILISTIVLVFMITYLILKASTKLLEIFGETGNNVMMRLMGLILMVIAVECFFSGLKPIMRDFIEAL